MDIKAYTDGACSGNPGKGGIGAIILEDDREVARISDGRRLTTNNRMEILAAATALETVIDRLAGNHGPSKETDIKVTVYSDSQMLVKTMSDGWTRKANKDLWKRLDEACDNLQDVFNAVVKFEKVPGHSGVRFNVIADQLAVQGSQACSDKPDSVYEDICKKVSVRPAVEPVAEPAVRDIRFCNHGDPENRRIEVSLTNGTIVKIIPCHGGFEQTECTQREASVTVDIAWKFVGWLNGHKF
jgi:ribonuclease HI